MRFVIDLPATGMLLGILFLIYILKIFLFPNSLSPTLAFSRLADLKHSSWRSQIAVFPKKLHFTALISLSIAFIDPHFLLPKSSTFFNQDFQPNTLPKEGIAIYLIIDCSGSMAENVETTLEDHQRESISKMNLLKRVTQQFILAHPSDLIGLVSFARIPKVLIPLTLDQEALLKQLNQIQVVKNEEEDGTSIGYAIYKTAHLLSATRHFANDLQQEGPPSPYTIKSAVMIVLTDGFQNPSRLDYGNRLRTMELDDAASYAKSQDIRLYIVNIDPILSTAKYAPQRRQLQAVTALTGGQFYLVNDSQKLQDIYSSIDKLEKGLISHRENVQTLDPQSDYTRFSLYPFFIFLGVISFFLSFLLEFVLLRGIP